MLNYRKVVQYSHPRCCSCLQEGLDESRKRKIAKKGNYKSQRLTLEYVFVCWSTAESVQLQRDQNVTERMWCDLHKCSATCMCSHNIHTYRKCISCGRRDMTMPKGNHLYWLKIWCYSLLLAGAAWRENQQILMLNLCFLVTSYFRQQLSTERRINTKKIFLLIWFSFWVYSSQF